MKKSNLIVILIIATVVLAAAGGLTFWGLTRSANSGREDHRGHDHASASHSEHEEGDGHGHDDHAGHDHAQEGDDHAGHSDSEEAGEHAGHDHGEHEEDEHGHEAHELRFSLEELEELEVSLEVARQGQLVKGVTLTGEIGLNEDRLVQIAPRISGSVSGIYGVLGRRISSGALLAELESRELAEARADYQAAEARAQLANEKYDREKTLYQKKLTAEQDYLDVRQMKVEAEIDRDRSWQQLLALGLTANEIRNSDASFSTYRLRAPFTGTIIEKKAVRGQTVAEGEPLFTLADLSDVWCDLILYPDDLEKVRVGQAVTVLVENRPVAVGKVAYIRPLLGRSTRSSTARVILDNKNGNFIPGMYVSASVETGRGGRTLLVDREAVHEIDGEQKVFVYREGLVEPVDVVLGASDSSSYEVVKGLTAGDRYLSGNSFVVRAELQKESFGGHVH